MNRAIGITSIIFFLFTFPLNAIEKDPLWEKKINYQIEFQNNLAMLLLRKVPEASDLISIQRDLQIATIEMRREEYYYVLEHAPSRITRNQGIAKWSNFDWTDEDTAGLLKVNGNYRDLRAKKKLLEKKNQGHPLWPLLRDRFSEVSITPEYKEIYKQLTDALQEIAASLKNTK